MKLFFSTSEVARALGISRHAAWTRIRGGVIPAFRLGGKYLVPRSFLGGPPLWVDDRDCFTAVEFADAFGLAPETVPELAKRGTIPWTAERTVPGAWVRQVLESFR